MPFAVGGVMILIGALLVGVAIHNNGPILVLEWKGEYDSQRAGTRLTTEEIAATAVASGQKERGTAPHE